MTKRQRLQEFKGSALEHFFAHTWWLVFSVSANHIFNASSFDKIDKLFSKEAWFKTINDPYQVRMSFRALVKQTNLSDQLPTI